MILLALVLVFIPFFSIPPFVLSSYVQPFTLLLGWLILIANLNLRFNLSFLMLICLFILYVLFLKFLFFGGTLLSGDLSVLVAYVVGFMQLFLFISLFKCIFDSYRKGDFIPFRRVQNALNCSLIIVIISVPLQLVGPVNFMLKLIKPRNVVLSDSGLAQSYRGLSGLMPEPSYLGTCLAILLLSSFLLGYFNFVFSQARSFPLVGDLYASNVFFGFGHYSQYCQIFVSSYYKQMIGSILALLLAFSPTSFLSYFLIVSVAGIPFFVQTLTGIIRPSFVRYLLIFISVGIALSFLSNLFFSQSRIVSLMSAAFSGEFVDLLTRDQSLADRYASSVLGAVSVLSYPFGLGLNGHGYLMSDCSNQLVQSLELMCGTIFNSNRNHNAIANLLIDAGVFAVFFMYIFMIGIGRVSSFLQFPLMSKAFKYSFVFITVSLLLLFIVLPAPLGSPFVWLPFSISIVCLLFLPCVCDQPIATDAPFG